MNFFYSHSYRRSAGGARQRGAVLLMSLIILAVLLAAGAALVRSFDTSLFQAGNLAFKRDLANQADRVTPIILARFQDTTRLGNAVTREAASEPNNYSAAMLATNAQGIPTDLLLADAAFDALPYATAANDLTPGSTPGVGDGITIRYLIDRMCLAAGNETALGAQCVGVDLASRAGSGPSGGRVATVARQVVYRISIRVDGPRNTQAFFQSTLSL